MGLWWTLYQQPVCADMEHHCSPTTAHVAAKAPWLTIVNEGKEVLKEAQPHMKCTSCRWHLAFWVEHDLLLSLVYLWTC